MSRPLTDTRPTLGELSADPKYAYPHSLNSVYRKNGIGILHQHEKTG